MVGPLLSANPYIDIFDEVSTSFKTLLVEDIVPPMWPGNKGVLRPGDLQWMTAGRGVVHSEMPGEAMTRGLQVRISTYLGISTPYLHYLHHLSDPRAARARTTAAPTPTINVILDIFHFLYFPLLIRSIFCPSIAISPLSCRDCKGN